MIHIIYNGKLNCHFSIVLHKYKYIVSKVDNDDPHYRIVTITKHLTTNLKNMRTYDT